MAWQGLAVTIATVLLSSTQKPLNSLTQLCSTTMWPRLWSSHSQWLLLPWGHAVEQSWVILQRTLTKSTTHQAFLEIASSLVFYMPQIPWGYFLPVSGLSKQWTRKSSECPWNSGMGLVDCTFKGAIPFKLCALGGRGWKMVSLSQI